MPIMVIGLKIILVSFIFIITTHKDKTENFFSVGQLQANVITNYLELEKEFFYYEKILEYNEYKSVKEFAGDGAVPENCNEKWRFNSDCEPYFKEYLKEKLNDNLGENKVVNIDSDIEVYFKDFDLSVKTNTAEVNYDGPIKVKKKPLVNFEELEKLKSDIRNCIETKNMDSCNPESNSGKVYAFRRKIADILDKNLEPEEIFLGFRIDMSDSGIKNSIF